MLHTVRKLSYISPYPTFLKVRYYNINSAILKQEKLQHFTENQLIHFKRTIAVVKVNLNHWHFLKVFLKGTKLNIENTRATKQLNLLITARTLNLVNDLEKQFYLCPSEEDLLT